MSSRRHLGTVFDDQAEIAASHLRSLEANKVERLELNYPLTSLTPSASNPRRLSLDNAGVNAEQIKELAILPREGLEGWMARLERFLDSLERRSASAKVLSVWTELFDLAISIYTTDLLQPIVAKFDGEIIAGERRWTALQLAGKSHGRVILRQVPEQMENIYRLIENVHRSDLSTAETAIAIRLIMTEITGVPCGPENTALTMQKIQSVLGSGQTQSAYYRAICRLPEDDPLLAQIVSGAYTSLRMAYEDASKRLREIAALASSGGETPPPLNTSQDSRTKQKTTGNPLPQFKARIPGTEGGLRFIQAIESIDGVANETLERIQAIRTGWAGAPDKARKKMFAEALDRLFADLDQLELGDEA
ncbi:ParB/RepB/Spo0J family partition protein [Stutzerimonas stutzeri]|uniref:ParB/RepB/Spo0J family partition protein n=1 Tax=Stutzerimonas stutzeri TaxID=316 RepID=UPI0015E39E3E|nr:ParB N-terminal domain-containing protein [Stutzerimonas stutzeri]MBA1280295.1 ParB N-terminal domain-containing protein [Stutzerimonas stutzeri]